MVAGRARAQPDNVYSLSQPSRRLFNVGSSHSWTNTSPPNMARSTGEKESSDQMSAVHKQLLQWELGKSPDLPDHLGTRAYNALSIQHFGHHNWTLDDVAAISP